MDGWLWESFLTVRFPANLRKGIFSEVLVQYMLSDSFVVRYRESGQRQIGASLRGPVPDYTDIDLFPPFVEQSGIKIRLIRELLLADAAKNNVQGPVDLPFFKRVDNPPLRLWRSGLARRFAWDRTPPRRTCWGFRRWSMPG
jgi:hypothetical protein